MGKFKLTPEIIEKAKAAKSALELITIAKTEGIEISIEEGKVAFAQLSPKTGELRDDEIDNVAGGACEPSGDYEETKDWGTSGACPGCGSYHIKNYYGDEENEYTCKDCGHVWKVMWNKPPDSLSKK